MNKEGSAVSEQAQYGLNHEAETRCPSPHEGNEGGICGDEGQAQMPNRQASLA